MQAAQKALAEIKRKRKQLDDKGGNGKKPKEPRASTTDPQARVMKMADAGFRPAYNVQVASAAGELIVVAIDVDNSGSDRGLMRPMLERTRARLKGLPRRFARPKPAGSSKSTPSSPGWPIPSRFLITWRRGPTARPWRSAARRRMKWFAIGLTAWPNSRRIGR